MRNAANPLLRMFATRTVMGPENVRGVLAMARVLRAAVVHRASGGMLDLADPFGDRLLWSDPENPTAVWSVGSDARDDGGHGEFDIRPGVDVVLELRR